MIGPVMTDEPNPPGPAEHIGPPSEGLFALGARLFDDETGPLPETATLLHALAELRPTEQALERAALAVLGAGRARHLSWSQLGAVLGLSDAGTRTYYNRLRQRHPVYTPPRPITLAAYTAHAHTLLGSTADPPDEYTDHAAARLLGAVLLTAALNRTPELVATWLSDPTLHAATAAAARHPEAHQVLIDHGGRRPGIRADLVDIAREAIQNSPWAPAAEGAEPSGHGPDADADTVPNPLPGEPVVLTAIDGTKPRGRRLPSAGHLTRRRPEL
jgi:hypothetical protein